MPNVFFSTVINAPIERVWRSISDFNGLPDWMPGMTGSHIEDGKDPAQVGSVRVLSMAGGGKARERLEEISSEDKLIVYSVLEAPIPVRNVRNGMRLRPITDTHGTFCEWFSDFETEPGAEKDGAEFLRRVFSSGYRGLKRHLGV
ncbi:SRPBCC family protein [Mesorhizobium sp.]|uniref:SRPBCC family protein n=1 Tax=Mesorhizobium sp. TaxID=1871066 RepID=UPI0025D732F4|nr:SRPBCC family protein [Mesorhizobium sp.]